MPSQVTFGATFRADFCEKKVYGIASLLLLRGRHDGQVVVRRVREVRQGDGGGGRPRGRSRQVVVAHGRRLHGRRRGGGVLVGARCRVAAVVVVRVVGRQVGVGRRGGGARLLKSGGLSKCIFNIFSYNY